MMTIKAQSGAAVRPARVSTVRVTATLPATVLETKVRQSGAIVAATMTAALLMNAGPSMAFGDKNNAGLGGVLPEQPRRDAANSIKNAGDKAKGLVNQNAPNLSGAGDAAKGALGKIQDLGKGSGLGNINIPRNS